jgi:glucose/arabinose dehydrogenase
MQDIIIYASGFHYLNLSIEMAATKSKGRSATSNDFRNCAIHSAGIFPRIINTDKFDNKFYSKLRESLKVVKTFRRIGIIGHGNPTSIGLSGTIRFPDQKGGSWIRFNSSINEKSLETFPDDLVNILIKKSTEDSEVILFSCRSGVAPKPDELKDIGQSVADTLGIPTIGFKTYLLYCVETRAGGWPIKEYVGAVLEPMGYDPYEFLILERNEGKVYRVTNGETDSKPLLDVNVATDGYRGMLGITSFTKDNLTNIFLYFTEANSRDGDDSDKSNPKEPLGNRVYKYELREGQILNPKLILDLPALPGPRHPGGILAVGPDENLYVTVGDIDGTFREGYETMAQNYQNGSSPDGRSGILRITLDGKSVGNGILDNKYPLDLYYAYGIRNSFGIDWDPVTGDLWDTENGPHYGDEINRVEPGFNSGWVSVQGLWKPNLDEKGKLSLNPKDLVDFDGKGKYSPPELTWVPPVAPTALKFFNSDKLGDPYKNDLFVADANTGSLYHFDLNDNRTELELQGLLQDKIANSLDETRDIIFANGFGRITDLEIGPDGYLYILSSEDDGGALYKISKISHEGN